MAKSYQNIPGQKRKFKSLNHVSYRQGKKLKKRPNIRIVNLILVGGFVIGLVLLLLASLQIKSQNKYIVSEQDIPENISYGIVFGSGVNVDFKPYDELRARLTVAAQSVKDGKIQKLLVTGDNRTLEYNEPTVMKNYLIDNFDIEPSKIQEDFAGRSTYESRGGR